jgi:hypothetical protein
MISTGDKVLGKQVGNRFSTLRQHDDHIMVAIVVRQVNFPQVSKKPEVRRLAGGWRLETGGLVPSTKYQVPRTKNQEPRTKNQEPRTKNLIVGKKIGGGKIDLSGPVRMGFGNRLVSNCEATLMGGGPIYLLARWARFGRRPRDSNAVLSDFRCGN